MIEHRRLGLAFTSLLYFMLSAGTTASYGLSNTAGVEQPSDVYVSVYADSVGADSGAPRAGAKIHHALARRVRDLAPAETVKTWVLFKDKGVATRRAYDEAIRDVASKYNRRAIQRRRNRRTLSALFDEYDLPVVPAYISQVEATGAKVHVVSKWVNSVSVHATKAQLRQIDALAFVKAIEPVRRSRRIDSPEAEKTHTDVAVSGSSRSALGGGDTCATATVIPSIPYRDTGTTVGLTADYHEECPGSFSEPSPGAPDVVYSYTPTEDTTISIELCNGSDYNTTLYVYENICESGTLIACNDDTCGRRSAIYDLALSAGSTYYIVIDGSTGVGTTDAGNYVLDVLQGGSWYGQAVYQLEEINLVSVHDLGYTAQDVVIGVLDGGFSRDPYPAFNNPAHPLNVIAEWDFVNDDPDTTTVPSDPIGDGWHGAWVLGVLAPYVPYELVGGAYDASFILCKTEDEGEYRGEEDNFVAGLEFIEANGGDMATSSLGYSVFDYWPDSYQQSDMDGLTAICTIGANIATGKGLHLCNCMGNEGHDTDPATSHLITPADGFQVISVGAVYSDGSIVDYSSDGPTADGRVKPEVLARGENVRSISAAYLTQDYQGIGGRSFSVPLVASAVACLTQAHPNWTPERMRQALLETADYYVANGTFDPLYVRGYGVINALAALQHNDCNVNSVADECDLDCDAPGCEAPCGTSQDCNDNAIPDDCELDCDGDGTPNDCETDVGEQDCNVDGVCNGARIAACPPDTLSCGDCNNNGLPDECDRDSNGNGIPDDCDAKPPVYPSDPQHQAAKNRYVSIDPTTSGAMPVGFQVQLTSMRRCSGDDRRACVTLADCPRVCDGNHNLQCEYNAICGADGPCVPTSPCVEHASVGTTKWVDQPSVNTCVPLSDCSDQWFAGLAGAPVFRVWTEDTVHVTGCEIVPAAEYEVRTTADGTLFTDPLTIGTIAKPQVHYGDCVGPVVSGQYTPPDGFVSVVDVQAYLIANQAGASAPHTTWVDLQGVSGTSICIPPDGGCVVPQQILNVGDLQTIKFGFLGQTYVDTPGHENPGDCPP